MNLILKKINIIPVLFFSNIIALFTENHYISYFIIAIYTIYYLSFLLRTKMIKKYLDTKFIFLIFLLITIMLVSTLVSLRKFSDLKNFVKLFIMICTITLGFELAYIEKDCYLINGLTKLNKVMTIINIYGIFEYILKYNFFIDFIVNDTVKNWHTWSIGTQYYRIFTVFTHPIIYANILIICFWINIFLEKSKKFKAVNTILISFCIYATKSRSTWIALGITILLYYICKRFKYMKNKNQVSIKSSIHIITMIIVLILLFQTPIFKEVFSNIVYRFAEIFKSGGAESTNQRIGSIKYIFDTLYNQSITNTFIGNGFGSIADVMSKVTIQIKDFSSTDNQYLSILVEFGIIGLIINFMIIINMMMNYIKSKVIFEKVLLIIFISISINMFFYELYGWNIILYIYLLILGIRCVNLKNKYNSVV